LTGRFLQVDPVFGGSADAYSYTCDDPLSKTDLTGEISDYRHTGCNAGEGLSVAFDFDGVGGQIKADIEYKVGDQTEWQETEVALLGSKDGLVPAGLGRAQVVVANPTAKITIVGIEIQYADGAVLITRATCVQNDLGPPWLGCPQLTE
jgi:hypothetical protein